MDTLTPYPEWPLIQVRQGQSDLWFWTVRADLAEPGGLSRYDWVGVSGLAVDLADVQLAICYAVDQGRHLPGVAEHLLLLMLEKW